MTWAGVGGDTFHRRQQGVPAGVADTRLKVMTSDTAVHVSELDAEATFGPAAPAAPAAPATPDELPSRLETVLRRGERSR